MTKPSKFSLTYIGTIVFALGYAMQLAGVPFVEADLETTVTTVFAVIGAIASLWGRYRAGGVHIWGGRAT